MKDMENKHIALLTIVLGVLFFACSIVVLLILITPYPWLAVFEVENPLFVSIMVACAFALFGVFLIIEGFIFFRKKGTGQLKS
jgi:hypothetical protein